MAKRPEFRLYRICDSRNGKALQGFHGYKPYFTQLGAFYRSPETIRKHIKSLIHEHTFELPKKGSLPYGRWVRGNEIPGRINDLYVECYSVLELSSYAESASKYLGRE